VETSQEFEAGSQILGLPTAFPAALKPSDSQRGFRLGRILELYKQELSISGLFSGSRQTPAPREPYSRLMSGM
jgi:hypothetical protein